jgi:hypothetical protein
VCSPRFINMQAYIPLMATYEITYIPFKIITQTIVIKTELANTWQNDLVGNISVNINSQKWYYKIRKQVLYNISSYKTSYYNKIGQVYCLEYTEIPKVTFMSRDGR